jgi:hypothetical protein
MLLLFWHPQGSAAGTISNMRWLHTIPNAPSRCLGGADAGISIFNPNLLHPDNLQECAYISTSVPITATCFLNEEILGGASLGVYAVPWSAIGNSCAVENPTDATASTYLKYTTASGILSNNVKHIDSYGNYLGIVTDEGLSWKLGDSFINFATTSGKEVFIDAGPTTYLADGSTIRIKYGEPLSFATWDVEIDLGVEINGLWVNRETAFVATVSGLATIHGGAVYQYTNLSGTLDISSVRTEIDSSISWGHAFTLSSECVNVINLKHKTIERVLHSSSDSILLAAEYPRYYSK